MRGRILIVDKKVPTPDRDSGSASTFSYLQILSRAGYEIVFVPDTPAERDGYSRALDALGIKTLLAPEWTSTLAGVEAFAPRCDLSCSTALPSRRKSSRLPEEPRRRA